MLNNTKDFQETLHEVLNIKVKSKSHQDILLQTILNKSDKSEISEFQEMLKKNIKPLSHDKVKEDIKSKERKTEEHAKRLDIEKQIKSGADVDQVITNLDKDKENDEESTLESNPSSGESLSAKEETLKIMYSVALDEYNKLRGELYTHQIKDNDIALDSRNYTRLLVYENYLRKCDTLFKQNNGSYIANQDPEIFKKENKYEYEAAKSEKKIVDQHQNSVNEIDSLNNAIEDKANEIIELNEAAEKGTVRNYERKLEDLEQDYLKLTVKMHLLQPNILELYRQEEEKEKQEETTTRIVGTMYEKKKNKLVMDTDVVRLDKRVEGKEDKLKNSIETEKTELQNTNVKLASSYIDAAEAALEKDDVDEARHLASKAKELVGYKQMEDMASEKQIDFDKELKDGLSSNEVDNQIEVNETEMIDKHLNNVSNDNSGLSPVQKECLQATCTPEERDENALAREASEEIEKVKGEQVKEEVNER